MTLCILGRMEGGLSTAGGHPPQMSFSMTSDVMLTPKP